MVGPKKLLAFVVVIVIAVLAALCLARDCAHWTGGARRRPKFAGGTDNEAGDEIRIEFAGKVGHPLARTEGIKIEGGDLSDAMHTEVEGGVLASTELVAGIRHPMGVAIHEYARGLGVGDVLAHPLSRDRYTAPASGGASKSTKKPKKPWAEYATWDELQKDEGAVAAYLAQRTAAIEDPDFDWGPVLAAMQPKLAENREYIGVVNVSKDGRTLHIAQSEASPTAAGDTHSDTSFASVPASLVAAHGSRPGLFLFHTHPDDLRCCQFPSSHDLAAAIHFGVAARFAANAVISRYGVFVYGVDWSAYKAIKSADDPQLAKLHYSHDVVAAHESTRSWSSWTIPEYLAFYPRHRMFINSYPTPKLIGDTRRYSYLGDLELPVDHELITDHITDITAHQRGRGRLRKPRGASSRRAPLADLDDAPVAFD